MRAGFRRLLILLVVFGLLAAGCGRRKDSPSGDASKAPLTGVPLTDRSVASRPAVAVKVENSKASRPQTGLEQADMVFELLTEGGVTRFMAFYQSTIPDRVGPVRSSRPEDAKLLPAFNAMYFISGARPDVLDTLRNTKIKFAEEDGTNMRRDPARESPHNLYAVGPTLFDTAKNQKVSAAKALPWSFVDAPPPGAVPCPAPCQNDPGRSITVPMSREFVAGFTYDPAARVYRRLQDGQPFVMSNGMQIGAANVLVLATKVREAGCCDPAGMPLTETDIVSQGRGVVLRDGQRYAITWSKSAPESHFEIKLADGSPFAFKPGPTWILLAPEDAVR